MSKTKYGIKAQLRVFHNRTRLIKDFEDLAYEYFDKPGFLCVRGRSVYVPNVIRIYFVLDDMKNVVGYQGEEFFSDTDVNSEAIDYLKVKSTRI